MIMNGTLHEHFKVVTGFPPAASGTSDYVSLKNAGGVTAIAILDNATSVTGSTLTMTQAQAVAGTNAKPITSGTHSYQNIDTGAGDTLSAATTSSGVITTDTTDNKNLMYIFEVPASALDIANGFDCFSLVNASGSSTVIGIVYILWPMRYAAANPPTAITD